MKKNIKHKVYLTGTNTDAGVIYTLQCNQKVNRATILYYAYKSENGCKGSVFFIVRPKDCERLKISGYSIQSIKVPKNKYPIALNYGSYTALDYGGY